jgi:Carbohydrate esterase, sialic acid-specific acetylesterase
MCKFLVALTLAACSTHAGLSSPDGSRSNDAAQVDANIDAQPPRRKLVVIFGQSNAGSRGLVSELADPTLAIPYPAVPYIAEAGTDNNPPIITIAALGALGPRPSMAGEEAFGIELTLGRALDAAAPGQWAIAKFAFGSTALAGEWWPQGVWPTGQPNLFSQEITFVQQALVATDSDLGALIWIQGESDAVTVALGDRYQIELAEFVGAERLMLPADPTIPFIYGRLNINNPQPGAAAVRAGQDANQNRYAIMVDQDPFPLRSDLTHYTTPAVLDLGTLYATTVLGALHLSGL